MLKKKKRRTIQTEKLCENKSHGETCEMRVVSSRASWFIRLVWVRMWSFTGIMWCLKTLGFCFSLQDYLKQKYFLLTDIFFFLFLIIFAVRSGFRVGIGCDEFNNRRNKCGNLECKRVVFPLFSHFVGSHNCNILEIVCCVHCFRV